MRTKEQHLHITDFFDKVFNGNFSDTFLYKPNPGNGGDALITYGAHKAFKISNIPYEIFNSSAVSHQKANFIYSGGGNLVGIYEECKTFISSNIDKAKKLVIMPHTVKDNDDFLQNLPENVYIACREQVSYDYVIKFLGTERTFFVEDLAFLIDTKVDFPDINPTRNFFSLFPKDKILRKHVKLIIPAAKMLSKDKVTELNCFRTDAEKTNISIPKNNIDISEIINYDPSMENYEEVRKTCLHIFSYLDSFDLINTNRLHLAIAGSLLGKPVNFYPNSYWKNKEIYKASIKGKFSHINWMGDKT